MRVLIVIVSINILTLVSAETSNEIQRFKFKNLEDVKEPDRTENKVEVQTCKEECKCKLILIEWSS